MFDIPMQFIMHAIADYNMHDMKINDDVLALWWISIAFGTYAKI